MKHVRHFELDTTLDDLREKRAANQKHLDDDHRAGPNFFRR